MIQFAYREALDTNCCHNLTELQEEAGLLPWNQAIKNEFTFACHLAKNLKIDVTWDPFNENLITTAPNITLATLAQRARLPMEIQVEGSFNKAHCVPGGDPGFVAITTSTGQDLQIQIDGQAASPGLPSLREVIARTYGAAIWLSHLPGFPQPETEAIEGVDSKSELEAEEEMELESGPELEADEDKNLEYTQRENKTTRGGVGLWLVVYVEY